LPYPEILARQVLGPLGMTHSTYEQPLPAARAAEAATGYRADEAEDAHEDRIYPEMAAAGLWTTPSDLARLFAELALARSGGSKLISKEIAVEMTTKSANVPNAIGLGTSLFEKGGTMLFGQISAEHGFRARAYASLDGGYGAVIMTNSDNGAELSDQVFAAIAEEYHWPAVDRPLVRVVLDPAQREAFTGWYFQPKKTLLAAQVVDNAGTLEFRTPFNQRRKLVPIAADTLIDPDTGNRVRLSAAHALAYAQSDTFRSAFLSAGSDPPIMFMLEAGQFDEAVAALRARSPGKSELEELNELAYVLMAYAPASAVRVLVFTVAVFPQSSNAQDSLGEAYFAAHEPTHAIAAYQQALALIDADPFIPAEQKIWHRKNAQDALAKLQTK
ncbi:MAG TPA: serine hydrolase domain-containing protein, partial [Kofleriaceae bacterium]|nr:serine hydrolase domain-containing protein [Kofleriaceae bacterium]